MVPVQVYTKTSSRTVLTKNFNSLTMNKYSFLLLAVVVALLPACNKKKISDLERELALKNQQAEQLDRQLQTIQATNASLLDRLADLSVINKAGAESIQQSLENINKQYSFIENLTNKIQQKDSLNLVLVMNLRRSLADISDDDLQIEVRGGMVHVSISDKMLFRSGSFTLGSQAKNILGKLAAVINEHDDLQIMVEGHTDNVPMHNECLQDNWDLSAMRATSVVRSLQLNYYVAPDRLTASGRSEYIPKADNSTADGRAENRRTEIVIMPRLDQYFKLLESPQLAD